MEWTTELPVAHGHYWYRVKRNGQWICPAEILILDDIGITFDYEHYDAIEDFVKNDPKFPNDQHWWAGPILPPDHNS